MSKTNESVGFAVVGAGFMGKTHSQVVVDHVKNARLVGILDMDRARASELADKHRVKAYAALEEMLGDAAVDAVIVATPHAQHYATALPAAKAGKHLLIEKPMTCTVAHCDEIIAACKAKNLRCVVNYTQRARIGNMKAKELIDSGRLGKVKHIRTYQLVPGGMEFSPPWQQTPENVGILMGHGVHNLDACCWFTGCEIKSVFAKCRILYPEKYPIESTSDVMLTLSDGTVCYVFCCFEMPKPNFPRSEVAHRIVCEKGLIDVDPYDQTRASIEGGEWETIAVQPKIDFMGKGFLDPVRLESYTRILQDLVDAVREGRETKITAWDGRQAVAAAAAAYESSRTGQEIMLPS